MTGLMWRLAGVAGYVTAGILYVGAGLVAPPWAVAMLWAGYAAGAVGIVALWRRRLVVVASGPLAAAVWVAVVGIGSLVGGWTA